MSLKYRHYNLFTSSSRGGVSHRGDPGNTEHKDGLPRLLLHARNDELDIVTLVFYAVIA